MSEIDVEGLVQSATRAREQAYAPYSGFAVGAALLTEGGDVFVGANVENLSFGLTNCAERSCVFSAVTAGARQFVALVIVTDSSEPVVPCGACRQVLAEFAPDLRVICQNTSGATAEYTIAELLPRPQQGILA